MNPRLLYSPLGNRIYVVTRYTVESETVIIAQKKYDVTDDFVGLASRRGLVRAVAAARERAKEEGT